MKKDLELKADDIKDKDLLISLGKANLIRFAYIHEYYVKDINTNDYRW
jgi:hypothetical protein